MQRRLPDEPGVSGKRGVQERVPTDICDVLFDDKGQTITHVAYTTNVFQYERHDDLCVGGYHTQTKRWAFLGSVFAIDSLTEKFVRWAVQAGIQQKCYIGVYRVTREQDPPTPDKLKFFAGQEV